VRADLLERLGHNEEAAAEYKHAVLLTANTRRRAELMRRAEVCAAAGHESPIRSTAARSRAHLRGARRRPRAPARILGQVATNRLRTAHAAHGLTSRQFQVLGLLHDHGALAQSDLARIMDMAPSMLVTLLNPLEAEGLVERRRDPADRRRHFVALTKAGEKRFMSASQAHAAAEEELFASLDDRQREQLSGLLRALRDGLAREAQGACRTSGPAQ